MVTVEVGGEPGERKVCERRMERARENKCMDTHGGLCAISAGLAASDPCWSRVKSGGRSDRISGLWCHPGNGISLYKRNE